MAPALQTVTVNLHDMVMKLSGIGIKHLGS